MISRLELAERILTLAYLEVRAIETMAEDDLAALTDWKSKLYDAAEDVRVHDLHPLSDERGIFADHSN